MESKTEEAASAGEETAAGEAEGSCCILQEVLREGRVETVCVATCCGADAAE